MYVFDKQLDWSDIALGTLYMHFVYIILIS